MNRRDEEQKVYGLHACRALFRRRPDDIVRVYLTQDRVPMVGDLLHACAEKRLPYKIVGGQDLEKLTESTHHEGLCIVARPRPEPTPAQILDVPGPACIVAVAEVGNPHNVGAILRVAAQFGARALLIQGPGHRLSAAASRTAQGAAEALDVVHTDDLVSALDRCRAAGFVVCATSSHENGESLYARPLPTRTVVLLGSESDGLPEELLQRADRVLQIPGTGDVESLNVATAAGVILAELWRQHVAGRE